MLVCSGTGSVVDSAHMVGGSLFHGDCKTTWSECRCSPIGSRHRRHVMVNGGSDVTSSAIAAIGIHNVCQIGWGCPM